MSAFQKTIKNIKGQDVCWEKIFANYIFDQGFIFRVCKALLQLNNNLKNRRKSKTLHQRRYTYGK